MKDHSLGALADSKAFIEDIDGLLYQQARERTRDSIQRCKRAVDRLLREGTSIEYRGIPLVLTPCRSEDGLGSVPGWEGDPRVELYTDLWKFYHSTDHACFNEGCHFEELQPPLGIRSRSEFEIFPEVGEPSGTWIETQYFCFEAYLPDTDRNSQNNAQVAMEQRQEGIATAWPMSRYPDEGLQRQPIPEQIQCEWRGGRCEVLQEPDAPC